MKNNSVFFQDLGVLDYRSAWDYQEKLFNEILEIKSRNRQAEINGDAHQPEITPNHLLFVEHPPVFTIGKAGKMNHLLASTDLLNQRKISFFQTNRGGDITFHGPAQCVGYPILDLDNFFTDIGKYMRSLEDVMILTIAHYGLKGERSKGETGVWLEADHPAKARKICALGVRCSRWVTMHGWALNVNTDLTYFDLIVPCGIVGKQVTSIEKELGHSVDMEEVKGLIRENFAKVFGVEWGTQYTN